MLEESTINSIEMAWIDSLYSSHLKQQAACSAVGDSYSGWTEAKIPLTMFEKGGDDCVENILPARGLRVPTSLISSWWPKVAKTKIEPVVTSINLSELGASNCVSLNNRELPWYKNCSSLETFLWWKSHFGSTSPGWEWNGSRPYLAWCWISPGGPGGIVKLASDQLSVIPSELHTNLGMENPGEIQMVFHGPHPLRQDQDYQ